MNRKLLTSAIFPALVLLPVTNIAAQTLENLPRLEAMAARLLESKSKIFPNSKTSIRVTRLDPHLRLAKCSVKPVAYMPAHARITGHTTVGIRCEGKNSWNVYLQAFIRISTPVVIATRPIIRGTRIDGSGIKLVRKDITSMGQYYFTSIKQVIGMTAKSPIAAGQALLSHNLQKSLMVRRGEEVIIIAVIQGIRVKMKGKSLQDGTRGKQIRVRNSTSRRIVEGIVISPGVIQVNL